MQKNNIYIVGWGAIGKALAVFLSLQGKNVKAIRGSVNDGSTTLENTSVELPDGTFVESLIEVTTLKSIDKLEGLIALTTKSFTNKDLSETLQSKSTSTPIVILQNGLQVEEPFIHQGMTHVYRCVLFATSQILPNGTVRFRPVKDSPVGTIKGDPQTLLTITQQIDSPYFRFIPQTGIQQIVWNKAIMNTVFNSICPLLETDNGIFHRDPSAMDLARQLIASCISIAEKSGIHLDPQEIESGLIRISKASDGQLISTLQDINHGRHTEIESLNFEIAKLAHQQGLSAEAREILLLGQLIKLKEKLNLKTIVA